MTRFDRFLTALDLAGVKFIVVGGVAGTVHGWARFTKDLDIVYARDAANLEKLVGALSDYEPYLRGAPPRLPFHWDVETLQRGLNFTLTTTIGDLDVLGEITGGGRYEDLLPYTIEIEAFGVRCRVVTLEKLIALKRAAGRPRDFAAVAELEALLEERDKRS